MSTAVDTNIFIFLWDATDRISREAEQALAEAASQGALIISPAVYCELLALPTRTEAHLDAFFQSSDIAVDWEITEEVWREAARALQAYSTRRRSAHGRDPLPRRILADFLIGAHALVNGHALLTLDKRLYRSAFPRLKILTF